MTNPVVLSVLCSSFALSTLLPAQTKQEFAPRVDLHGDPLPDGAAVRCGTIRYRNAGWFKRVTFLPGAHDFVVSTRDNSPNVWNAETGTLVKEFNHSGHVSFVKVIRDTGAIAMLSTEINGEKRICRTWFTIRENGGGKQLSWKEPFTEHSVVFAISPDGKTLVTGTYHGMMKFRNLETGDETRAQSVTEGQLETIDWSPNGQRIAVGGRHGVILMNLGSEDNEIETLGKIGSAQVVKFSHDGTMLAVGSMRQGPAMLWDTVTGKLIRAMGNEADSYYREGLCFSPDDSLLFVPNNQKKRVDVFDVATGILKESFDAARTPPRAVDVSDDGRFLVSVGSESQMAVWDLKTGEQLTDRYPGHAEHAGDLTFTPDGKSIVSGGMQGTIRVWDAATGQQTARFDHDHWVSGLDVSADGKKIVSIGLDETVRTWQIDPALPVHKVDGHGPYGGNDQCAAAFTPDAAQFLSFGADFTLSRHDSVTGNQLERLSIRPTALKLEEHEEGKLKLDNRARMTMNVNSVQFNRKRTRLMLGVLGGVYGYDTVTGKEVFEYSPNDRVEKFAVSEDEMLLAVVLKIPGAEPNQQPAHLLQILELPTLNMLHGAIIPDFSYHLRFAHDNRTLALCCNAWKASRSRVSILFFDARSGEFGKKIPAGNSQIHQLAFSPDDDQIATSHSDTQILVWNVSKL